LNAPPIGVKIIEAGVKVRTDYDVSCRITQQFMKTSWRTK